MTGIKVAIYTLLTTAGLSTSLSALIFASVPTPAVAATNVLAQTAQTQVVQAAPQIVSGTTPVTMALAWGGVVLAATFGWKVSRAWSQMEMKQNALEERLAFVEDKCNRTPGCMMKSS